jgi:hypothetical protein
LYPSSPSSLPTQINYKIVDEFWHSDLASDPDNQNKAQVAVFVGFDERGRRLYDMHERRVRAGNLNLLLGKFRRSEYGARFRAATRTAKRPNGAVLGRRQFAQARCACVKKRKASQCDCQDCTYVEENLRRWHLARPGWHHAKRARVGGAPCDCRIHSALRPAAAAQLAAAEEEEAAAWLAAGAAAAEPGDEDATRRQRWYEATAAAAALRRSRQLAERYDGMTASTEALTAALLPCGQRAEPGYSLPGRVYAEYDHACAADSCPKQLFSPHDACGVTAEGLWRIFGSDCPVECSDELFEWYVWTMQQRGVTEDGKPTYSPEWTPRRGTRAEFLAEFRPKVRAWLYHSWRDRQLRHGLRVFEDRRSGRHVVALRSQVSGPLLRAAAFQVVWDHADVQPSPPQRHMALLRGATFTALRRLADAAAAAHQPSTEQMVALRQAEAQYVALSKTAHVQVDYAAQFETERAHNATCARMERHNFEVCHVGFGAYTEATREGRFRRKRPRERFQYKQQVYVFFAFFNAGYKPNARSHNIAQEDIDHFLKWGSMLHGEWFEGGKRLPGGPTGEARLPLPSTLSEAPMAPPPFPEYDRRLEDSDGCGSQYDSGTQHHQTAEWKTKTAAWPEARQAAAAAAQELAAAQAEQAAAEEREEAAEEEAAAAAARSAAEAAAARAAEAAARKAAAEGGIVRVHVKKVEHHGKAGATDGNGNLPTFAIRAAIESNKLVNPGTCEP